MKGLVRRRRTVPSPPLSCLAARQAAAGALEEEALRRGPVVAGHPAVAELGGLDATLGYLHRRWVTRLGVAVDVALETDGVSAVEAAWEAWERLADDRPGLAAILHCYADHPAVKAADDRHRSLVAGAAGCEARRLPSFRTAREPAAGGGRRTPAVPAGAH